MNKIQSMNQVESKGIIIIFFNILLFIVKDYVENILVPGEVKVQMNFSLEFNGIRSIIFSRSDLLFKNQTSNSKLYSFLVK